jgi:hypothetical protein
MDASEIIKGNRLIAEFMGFTKDSEDLYLIDNYDLRGEEEFQATYVNEMKFHTSWNWLMPVVAKCWEVRDDSEDTGYMLFEHNFVFVAEGDFMPSFKAVVKFIEEKNEEKGDNYVECYKCGEETLDHPEVNFCQHCLAHL